MSALNPADQRAVLFTTGELAQRLNAELRGPADVRLCGVETLEQAREGDLSFVRDAKNLAALASSKCSAAIASRRAVADAGEAVIGGKPLLVMPDADEGLIRVLTMLAKPTTPPAGVHASACIHPTARVAHTASIGPGVVIGAHSSVGDHTEVWSNAVIGAGVSIGASCVIHSCVVIQDRCVIGDHCTLHPGVVIGADGFGFRPAPDGKGLVKIPHIGNVVVENHVEIGANSTIDRGKFGSTLIGAGTKIDNLVQIGHNCRIGRSCVICGMCGIAGSVVLGDGVTLAGGVGLADNRTIGAGATIAARSGVMDDVPGGQTWAGYPARPARATMRLISTLDQLPDLVSQVRRVLKGADDRPSA